MLVVFGEKILIGIEVFLHLWDMFNDAWVLRRCHISTKSTNNVKYLSSWWIWN